MTKTQAEKDRDYRARNLAACKERRRAAYAKNKAKENEKARAYYHANRAALIAKMSERRRKRGEEIRKYTRQWHAANRVKKPLGYMLASARKRAKRLGLPFTITAGDVSIPDFCPVLGIKLVVAVGQGYARPEAPSIDRIDNALGYTPENVRIISFRANAIKRDMTRQECALLLKNWNAR